MRRTCGADASLAEARGYGSVTIEQIAAEAGVGKATVYRWWPWNADLLLEVVLDRWYEVGVAPETGADPAPHGVLERGFQKAELSA